MLFKALFYYSRCKLTINPPTPLEQSKITFGLSFGLTPVDNNKANYSSKYYLKVCLIVKSGVLNLFSDKSLLKFIV